MLKRVRKIMKNQDGMAVIEVVLLITALVLLAILFKNQIMAIAQSLFTSLTEELAAF